MNLIGINGFKRAGKGETGNAIAALFNGVVYQVGFADRLKIMAAMALGFEGAPRELIALMDEAKESWRFDISKHVGWDKGKYGDPDEEIRRSVKRLSGREYLQHFGNRAREQFGENFWIDQVLPNPVVLNDVPSDLRPEAERIANNHNLEYRYPDVDIVAITDLRYANEAKRIKDLGGVVWEVMRPECESDGHASEQTLPRHLIDATIVNDAGLDILRARVAQALLTTLPNPVAV